MLNCPSILRRVAKEDYEFYQMLLSNTAMACQPSSILTLFTDAEVSPNLRVTPAIDTVKAVFKHLEDSEGCREFFATTFESLQAGHSVLASVYSILHCTALHCTALHSLHGTALHSTAQHCTAQRYLFHVHVLHVGSLADNLGDMLCCDMLCCPVLC